MGTNGESDGQDDRHGNGNPIDQEDEDDVEATMIVVVEAGVEYENFGNDEDDRDRTKGTDLDCEQESSTGDLSCHPEERNGTMCWHQ